MIYLLGETTTTSSVTQWILLAVLLIFVVGIFVLNYFRSKKNQEGLKNMVQSLKVGDNVKTYSGLYGKIIEIVETTDGKVAVLETGSEKNKGIFSIDVNAIYGIDAKQPVVLDANGNPVEPNAPVEETKVEETKVEDQKVEVKEEPVKKSTKSKKEIVEPTKEIKTEEKPKKVAKTSKKKPE